VSRSWNDVISSNDLLWKRICSQHGFATTRNASVVPCHIEFAEPCSDCNIMPSSDDRVQLETNVRASSCSQSTASVSSPFASDDDCCDFQSQPSYKEVFLYRRRILHCFVRGQLLSICQISGYTNKITAIDYHNGFIATGMCLLFV